MAKRALLIRHVKNKRNDRLSRCLLALGYDIDWCCPAKGEPLPGIDGRYHVAIVYGGAQSANDGGNRPYIHREIHWIERWVSLGRPFLGICLGGQLLARALGARVEFHPHGLTEIGYSWVRPTAAAGGFLKWPQPFYEWHREGFEVPEQAELIAEGDVFPNQAFRFHQRVYGLQFHPEATPEIILAWMNEAPEFLDHPGAQSRARQLADLRRFDARTKWWLEGFLRNWLGSGEVEQRESDCTLSQAVQRP